MTETARDILDRVSAWPQGDVDELAEMARVIEARRSGCYEVTPDEEAAIREGLAELERGEWTSYRRRAAKAWFEKQGYDWSDWREQVEPMGWENWTRLRDYQREMYKGWREAGSPGQPTWTGIDWAGWEAIIEEKYGLAGFQFFYHTLY